MAKEAAATWMSLVCQLYSNFIYIKVDTREVIVLGVYSTAVIVEDKTVQANISDYKKKKSFWSRWKISLQLSEWLYVSYLDN